MPAISPIYDPVNKDVLALWDQERKDRKAEIDQRWLWRDGNHPNSLKVLPDEYDDNLTLNLCGQVIEDISGFMGTPTMTIEGDVPDEMQMLFQRTLEENAMDGLMSDEIEAGNVAGHNFIRIGIPDNTPVASDGMPLFDGEFVPDITLIDSRYVSVFWDIRKPNKKNVIFYRLSWGVGQSVWMQDIILSKYLPDDQKPNGRDDLWVIVEYLDAKSRGDYVEQMREVFPYPFSPIVEWKNERRPHEYYGKSSLAEDTIRLNRSVNFLGTNMARIIRFHAHPKTIITGAELGNINTSPDGLVMLPEGATIHNIEMQSDLLSSERFMNKLEGRLMAERRVVDQANIADKVGNITNFGVRMLYLNMNKMIQERWNLYGEAFEELGRKLLYMLRIDGTVSIKWADPLPVNRAELVQTIASEAAIGGTSMETLLSDLGRDYDSELSKRQQEASQQIDVQSAVRERMATRGIL